MPFKPYFTLFAEIRLMLRDKLPDATYRERITQLESALLQRLLDEYIAASRAKSLLGREVWERSAARVHASRILDILLKN